jgi:penicillin amidase
MSNFIDLLGPVLCKYLTWMGKRRLPQIEGSLRIQGLSAPVEVLRDRSGVPHIYAKNDHDLYFTQGFVHAQERLWQMELNRRTANGTLSELIGEAALDTDRTARTFGYRRLGREDWKLYDAPMQQAVIAYTEGVNAFLRDKASSMPVEFFLLGHKPEPWAVEDTMAFSHLLLWQLSHAWYSEIVRAQIIEAVGEEHAAEIEINYPDGNPCSLPDGIEFNKIDPDGNLRGARGPFLDRGKGSNAWAITGRKSVTGKPYLCNDMHLVLSLPGIWFENHLTSDQCNVTGVSVPSAPLVLVGHNETISWGITLAYIDCEDLFVEKFNPDNPRQYEYKGEMLDVEVIPESIPVKGWKEPFVENVMITRHGPIISDVVGHPEKRLAVNSMALRPCPAIMGWHRLNRAKGWDDFVDAMRLIEAPQLSICYADVNDNIGYWITGRTPIRAKGLGMIPAPGWTGEYEWVDEVPFEEMPHALNPKKGYVVNCNNKIIDDDYPYFLGTIWMNGYRVRRLSEMIESKEKLGPADFIAMQTDITCIPGQQFVELLKDFTSEDNDVKFALEKLRSWDGKLTTQSVAGTIYEVTRFTLVRNLVEPVLGKDLFYAYEGKAFNPVLFPDHEYFGNDTQAVLRMLQNPDSWWVTQAGGRQTVLEKSFKDAIAWLRSELGADATKWQWGKIHRLTIAHAMAMQKPLDQVFNRGPYEVGGDTDTPWQSAMAPDEPYDNKLWSPSVRHIFDMSDLSRCQFVLPCGQSGQLGSPHYDDLVESYLTGKLRTMLWTRDQIEADLEGKLTLVP